MLRRITGEKFYAKIDLKKGYLQLEVLKKSRHLTAFICEAGVFEFNRIPFGIKTAPAFFQSVMSRTVLAGLVHVICDVYLDDVIFYGDTIPQLEERFHAVLQRFQKFGIVVNSKKCSFGLQKIAFFRIRGI